MAIGFGEPVDVHGAFFSGQAGEGAWTTGVRVVGYRDGEEVARTDWFCRIGEVATWFEMNLENVDRIEFVATPVLGGAGWFGMDDFTYSFRGDLHDGSSELVILDFEDLSFKTTLTDSGYAGLDWEQGPGAFETELVIHQPAVPPDYEDDVATEDEQDGVQMRGGLGTAPRLVTDYQGVIRGDLSVFSNPPDTMGAVGPDHFVETLNTVFAVYDRDTGAELIRMNLGSFLPGSAGDPRVLFDQHSGRWIVLVSDFRERLYLAVSLTDDATGPWFKTSFVASSGSDAGTFPDYPTLGVDANGIYTAAYMFGGSNLMSIFAIDKAPLIAPVPSLGTITAFRLLPWEHAIQPAHTYGTPGAEYIVSRQSSTLIRVRRIDPPLTSPTLVEVGSVSVPSHSVPPDAPALGSTIPLGTVGFRLMMSVYRDGSIWTTHAVGVNGRAAARWYEIDPVGASLTQSGTVSDSTLHYFFPSIMVDRFGRVVMGFSGSHAGQFASAYYTGRSPGDPPGEMAPPTLLKAGLAPLNAPDGFGSNRFGDYSYTTLDPIGEFRIWTLQEYAHANDIWGTWIGVLGAADCNSNGVDDVDDIAGATSEDCNNNDIPDECEPDDDCNSNGEQDICDIALGTSQDCNANEVPDECDIAGGVSADADSNGTSDECEASLLYVDIDATGSAHGTSWTDAYTDLQKALFIAGLPSTVATEIWVAEGVYKPAGPGGKRSATFALVNGIGLYGGFNGTESVREERDPALHSTVLSGDLNGDDAGGTDIAENSFRVVTAIDLDATSVLDGFAIRAGNAGSFVPPALSGAGMYVKASSMQIVGCLFEDNNSPDSGAGLYNEGEPGPSITRCTFLNNHAGTFGGGMFNKSSGPMVIGCRFASNDAGSRGGGFNSGSSSTATLVNCMFTLNVATRGGGLSNNGNVQVFNCSFNGNIAATVGGGIFNTGGGSSGVTTNCVLWGNSDSGGTDETAQITVSNGSMTLTFCNVQGWSTPGVDGNIASDPLFADADGADNTLGTPDDDLSLTAGSPCIDAGNNTAVPVGVNVDFAGESRFADDPDTSDTGIGAAPIVDMGLDEFNVGCGTTCGDLDGSGGAVNLVDFATFALCFGSLPSSSPACFCSDLNGDGANDLQDFATFGLLFGTASTDVPPNCTP
jgi:hypothetical protein